MPRPASLGPLLLCVASLAGSAHAAPSDADLRAARRMFEEAQAHEDKGEWHDALGLLRRILLVKETAGIRFHMGLCEEHLAQLLAAESDYRRASELSPGLPAAERDALQGKTTDALARLKPRIPLYTVSVAADVPGLSVKADGAALAATSLNRPLPHDPGDVVIEASAPGRTSARVTRVLREGENVTLSIELPPEASVAPPPPSTPLPPSPPPRPPSRPLWPIVVGGGLTVAGAAVAIGFAVRHGGLSEETDARCADPAWICDRAGRDDKLDAYRLYGILGAGGAVVGLGLLTYGLVRSPTPERPGTSLVVGPGSVGLVGRFLLRSRPPTASRPGVSGAVAATRKDTEGATRRGASTRGGEPSSQGRPSRSRSKHQIGGGGREEQWPDHFQEMTVTRRGVALTIGRSPLPGGVPVRRGNDGSRGVVVSGW